MNNIKYQTTGQIYIISAPSGAGKTSLVKKICEKYDFIKPSISFTTRKIRDAEVNGIDYFFITKDEFEDKINKNEFLEYQNVYGNYYGSSLESVKKIINQGYDVLLEIDYKGMLVVKELIPESLAIYILPPDIETLKKRLKDRGQDDIEAINKRMQSCEQELSNSHFADFTVVNDEFLLALNNLTKIILFNKINSPLMAGWVDSLIGLKQDI
jgi:guanylate kinase